MAKKLRAAVIGAGGAGTNFHLPVYQTHPDVEFVGICDANDDALVRCQMKHGLSKTQLYTALDPLLKEGLDLVSVCVPNYLHEEMTVRSLLAGANVLCEKPPARKPREVEQMIKTAEKTGKKLFWQFNNRFRPEVLWLLGKILDGYFGEIVQAQVKWVRCDGIPGWGQWFTQEEKSGGGPMIDLLVHMLDLAMLAMGYPEPKFILATANSLHDNDRNFEGPWCPSNPKGTFDVETAGQGTISFGHGRSILFEASWASLVERERVSCALQGKDAGSLLERVFSQDGDDATAQDRCLIVEVGDYGRVCQEYKGKFDPMMGRHTSVERVIQNLSSDVPDLLLPTPEQGLALMRIIEGIYASAEKRGSPVTLTET